MPRYVLGFLFTPDCKHVVLVRPLAPAPGAGKLNGIGGKLGPGENERAGVGREFLEQTGVSIAPIDWRPVARLWGRNYEILGFSAFSEAARNVKSISGDPINLLPIRHDFFQEDGALGLSWVIAAALDPHKPVLDIRVRDGDPDWATCPSGQDWKC